MEEVDRITQEQCEKELNWTEFTPAIVAQHCDAQTKNYKGRNRGKGRKSLGYKY